MNKKQYQCYYCGTALIRRTLPHGWTSLNRGEHKIYICKECRENEIWKKHEP